MTIIYLDLETIGTDDESVVSVKPPGNLRKAESIAKWEAEEKPQAIKEALAKTAFDGTYGRIICAGIAINDGPPQSFVAETEHALISGLFHTIREASAIDYHGGSTEQATFVGHNITGFDLPFLKKRAIILGIHPPGVIPLNAKPWDRSVFDTMVQWDADRDKRIGLDKLCKVLGIESPKVDMDGSKVGEYFKDGRIAEIATYCRADVAAVRHVYKRMIFA